MLKALFLDLDETLCDTTSANLKARDNLAEKVDSLTPETLDSLQLANDYLSGIYKVFDEEMKELFLPITCEEEFRTDLLAYLFQKHGIQTEISRDTFHQLRNGFDQYRIDCFDFFPGVKKLIAELREEFTLVVITNGPIYSQHPKVNKLNLRNHVDHVIIGGEEPEEKPYSSIFMKACKFADCSPEEAIHVGDSLAADITGAVNAGIKSVWISPGLKDDPRPDHIISNFIHIKPVLETYKK